LLALLVRIYLVALVDLLTSALAAAFPSIVMIALWAVLATQMKNPSSSQYYGLIFAFCTGSLNRESRC